MMNHLHLNILLVWLFANKNYSLHSLKRRKKKKKKRRESTFVTVIYQMIMTLNLVSNFVLSQMSNCENNDIHWFTTGSSRRIWGTIFVWIFFSCDYLLTRIRVYIRWKEKIRESTFVTLIYQMIMTFNVVSNFALSQMSNCEYNNIHWFTTRSSHRIWGTIFCLSSLLF